MPTLSQTIESNHLVSIPAGNVQLRDDRLGTAWELAIEPFYLSKYLVTQEQYSELTGLKPSTFVGQELPVESVSWREAAAFCNLLSLSAGLQPCYVFPVEVDNEAATQMQFLPTSNGYRLPTDAEWQYACLAGQGMVTEAHMPEIAWYVENANRTTHPVGTKQQNAWGLYDMLGNVWEWCSDIYDEQVYGSYRIIRGGGWADSARGCLPTNRRRSHPTAFRIDDLGFRVARNA